MGLFYPGGANQEKCMELEITRVEISSIFFDLCKPSLAFVRLIICIYNKYLLKGFEDV
jgi:hypothetical protein